MPRLSVFFLSTVLLLALHLPRNTFGQETNPRQNYLNQLGKINSAREEYVTARSSYLSFKTATAKNQAFIKTKAYLLEANLLYTSYIKLIESIGNKVNWQNTTIDKESQFNTINTQLELLSTNLNKINSANTLEELPPIAQELKNHINASIKPKIDLILINFNIASTESTQAIFNEITISLISFATSRIGASQPFLLANWQSEIENINVNIQESLTEIKSDLEKLSESRSPSKETSNRITQAKSALNRSKGLFAEILKAL